MEIIERAIVSHKKHEKDVALRLAANHIGRLEQEMKMFREHEVEPLERKIEAQRLQIEQLERHIRGGE